MCLALCCVASPLADVAAGCGSWVPVAASVSAQCSRLLGGNADWGTGAEVTSEVMFNFETILLCTDQFIVTHNWLILDCYFKCSK